MGGATGGVAGGIVGGIVGGGVGGRGVVGSRGEVGAIVVARKVSKNQSYEMRSSRSWRGRNGHNAHVELLADDIVYSEVITTRVLGRLINNKERLEI